MARDVVERLRRRFLLRDSLGNPFVRRLEVSEVEALLAVVEAAKEYQLARNDPSRGAVYRAAKGQALWDSLARFYAGSSGESD